MQETKKWRLRRCVFLTNYCFHTFQRKSLNKHCRRCSIRANWKFTFGTVLLCLASLASFASVSLAFSAAITDARFLVNDLRGPLAQCLLVQVYGLTAARCRYVNQYTANRARHWKFSDRTGRLFLFDGSTNSVTKRSTRWVDLHCPGLGRFSERTRVGENLLM